MTPDILASADHLLSVAASMLVIVPLAGLAIVALWGWLTRGRGL